MPRPKRGEPPWKAIAVKVPPDLLAAVQRFSDRDPHKRSISQLVREGLEYVLGRATSASPSVERHTLSRDVLLSLAQTLTRASGHLQEVCEQAGISQKYNGNTLQGWPPPVTPAELALLPAKRVLRPLCERGHAYEGTGQTLCREVHSRTRAGNPRVSYVCLACDAEHAKDRRARAATKQQAS